MAEETNREELIELVSKKFFRVYDGKTLFMIPANGSLTADELRIIADEMDSRRGS